MKTSDEIINVAKKICEQEHLVLDDSNEKGGSFKKVYKVTASQNVEYALKVIKSTIRSPRIIREISAIQKCDHPNISKIYKFSNIEYKGNEYDYIIEEYLGGGNLTNYLDNNSFLKRKDGIQIGSTLISTIEHLCNRKLVHRDIKPDNIMFRNSSLDPVLVDFSIVRDLVDTSLTQSWVGRGPGTPLFSAPEQLNNQKKIIDWRTDQFSLGLVMAIAIMRFHPYQEDSLQMERPETVENIINRKRNKNFIEKCKEHKFNCLERMTRPWPVERFRLPSDLISSWNKQETING